MSLSPQPSQTTSTPVRDYVDFLAALKPQEVIGVLIHGYPCYLGLFHRFDIPTGLIEMHDWGHGKTISLDVCFVGMVIHRMYCA